jgi:hypothetical protein
MAGLLAVALISAGCGGGSDNALPSVQKPTGNETPVTGKAAEKGNTGNNAPADPSKMKLAD